MRLYLLLLFLWSGWALQAQKQDSLAICKLRPDYSWESYAVPELGYDFYTPLNDSLGNAYHGQVFALASISIAMMMRAGGPPT